MLDLSLFRNPTFSGANTVMFLVGLAMFGIFFFNSLFLQNILGYGAIKTGATLPADDGADHPRRAGRGKDLRPGRAALADGSGDGSADRLAAAVRPRSTRIRVVGDPSRPPRRRIRDGDHDGADDRRRNGLGPIDKAGVGSAVINSMRQVGGSLGIAVMGALVATKLTASSPADPRYAAQFVEGYHLAVHVGAGLVLIGAVIAVLTIRQVAHKPHGAAEPAVGA